MFGSTAAENKANWSLSPKSQHVTLLAPIFPIARSAAGEYPQINFLPLEVGGLRWG
jgi:hypothetical protein